MNEPSNFVEGSLNGCTQNSLDEPPYVPSKLFYKLNNNLIYSVLFGLRYSGWKIVCQISLSQCSTIFKQPL